MTYIYMAYLVAAVLLAAGVIALVTHSPVFIKRRESNRYRRRH
jgi:hypothetical protein